MEKKKMVIGLWKLQKGVTMEEYRKWGEVDMKITNKLPFVKSFKVFKVCEMDQGLDKNIKKELDFDILEISEVTDFDKWRYMDRIDHMKSICEEWSKFADIKTLKVQYVVEL